MGKPKPHKRRYGGGGHPEARANRHAGPPGAGVARLLEDDLYALIDETDEVLLLILDGVQDPHNLGACLRSADGAGVTALVIPKDRAAPMTETAIRIACGAAESVPVVSVTNLARFLEKLREDHAMRVVGTSDRATADLYETNLTGRLALVMGSEEKGMRRLTEENCDELIRIPMMGSVECLNVSNAAAVCLFESVRQRLAAEERE
ncbi:MAG: 23S rRNA (guanosine(2251)-2'-O)-methyltransferase RlmB [Verrucomicrobiae bacterium]|nr:23S rRNA (guanosine(2251)-2'-O)-methyltransferase RlmB [Verrucomicrobiae bacterium]MCB1093067.1 23S rRNA (guanosine(2251)-2'-O)-methyltransferase RlmB [Verrucomicrobiae bacterium]